jgi:HIV Tat-specific factor 1
MIADFGTSRLADWDDDDPSAMPDTSSRWVKVGVLKQMFILQQLEEDPAALLEIKEDVREECEKHGKVTNVVLYDKEEVGVMTVRSSNAMAAEACAKVFDGRWFDKRRMEAYITDSNEKFSEFIKGDKA